MVGLRDSVQGRETGNCEKLSRGHESINVPLKIHYEAAIVYEQCSVNLDIQFYVIIMVLVL